MYHFQLQDTILFNLHIFVFKLDAFVHLPNCFNKRNYSVFLKLISIQLSFVCLLLFFL